LFLGSHQHNIDNKGRLTLPSKWRGELNGSVVITRGMEGCLYIFPQAKFEQIASEIDRQGIAFAQVRAWARYLGAESDAVEVDGQGRILITQHLREYAGLNGIAIVVGLMSRIEVWSPEKYKAVNAELEANAAAISENMGNLLLQMAHVPEKA
jgi:MraZ protein